MKLIDKYIAKQIFKATILGVLLFIVIWISPEILFKIINRTFNGEISPTTAVNLFFLEIPEILGKALPVGLLIGTVYIFDRLSKDFELVILRSIGVSLKRLAIPIIVLSSFLSVLCFITYDKLIPHSTTQIKKITNYTSDTQFVYVDKTPDGKPKQAVIVAYFDGKNLHNINVLNFADTVSSDNPLIKNIITAQRAYPQQDKWVLKKGINYKIASNGVYETITPFDESEILQGKPALKAFKLLKYSIKNEKELTNSELLSYVNLLKKENLTDEYRFMLNKFYQRFSQAFSCILFAICGIILGYSKPRQARAIGFTAATGIIALYYMTLPFIDLLAEKGVLPPIAAASLPCIFVATCIAIFIKFKEL